MIDCRRRPAAQQQRLPNDNDANIANELHGNYYMRRRLLSAAAISEDLDQIAALLEILEPLTIVD